MWRASKQRSGSAARARGAGSGLSRELLQLLEATLLFLQQALLAFADQLEVARSLRSGGSRGEKKQQPDGHKSTARRHAFSPLNTKIRRALKHMALSHQPINR